MIFKQGDLCTVHGEGLTGRSRVYSAYGATGGNVTIRAGCGSGNVYTHHQTEPTMMCIVLAVTNDTPDYAVPEHVEHQILLENGRVFNNVRSMWLTHAQEQQ